MQARIGTPANIRRAARLSALFYTLIAQLSVPSAPFPPCCAASRLAALDGQHASAFSAACTSFLHLLLCHLAYHLMDFGRGMTFFTGFHFYLTPGMPLDVAGGLTLQPYKALSTPLQQALAALYVFNALLNARQLPVNPRYLLLQPAGRPVQTLVERRVATRKKKHYHGG